VTREPHLEVAYMNLKTGWKRLVEVQAMKLSKPIDTYVQAINAGDAAALQSSFADHAVVKDVGREFRGIAAIKEWASQEIFAVNVVLEVIDAVESDGRITLKVKIDGTFDRTGLPDPLLMEHCFTLADDKIVTLNCRLASEGRV
jgi:hypothetical protein